MSERQLLRDQWHIVANALSIKFVAPFILKLRDGTEWEFACLLPQFGKQQGMLIDAEYSANAFSVAVESGYAVSSMLAEHHHLPINAENYIECLVEWGWVAVNQNRNGMQMPPNKSLKAVRIRSLDSLNRRMLRIICAACVCPLARRYAPSENVFCS
jgi:hypothetical protein